MKRFKFVISLISLAIVAIFAAQYVISVSGTQKVREKTFVAKEITDDINGDGKEDIITLCGKKTFPEGRIYNGLNITLTDGKSKMKRKTNMTHLFGTDPEISTYDFTGDGKKEIFITAISDEENQTLSAAVINTCGDILRNLFSVKDNGGIYMKMDFYRDFVINASFESGQKFSIDISHIKDALINYGIYTPDGEYTGLDTPFILPYLHLTPVDYDSDSVFELCGTQKIITSYSRLPIVSVTSVLKYENGEFVLKQLEYTI